MPANNAPTLPTTRPRPSNSLLRRRQRRATANLLVRARQRPRAGHPRSPRQGWDSTRRILTNGEQLLPPGDGRSYAPALVRSALPRRDFEGPNDGDDATRGRGRHPLRRRLAAPVDLRPVRHRGPRPHPAHRRDASHDRRPAQLPLVFKASFDKANRTSGKSFRGVGLDDGLDDPRRRPQGHRAARHDRHSRSAPRPPRRRKCCDVLQVPAFLARQTDLLEACGEDRPRGEREEGAVHGPVGHEERRREARGGREPSRFCSPSAAPRSATECWSTTCGRSRGCRKLGRR